MSDLLELAKAIEPQLIEIRRDFHKNPEIAFQEIRTGKIVAEFCEQHGLQTQTGAAKTGVIAELRPESNADSLPVLALRADMDALPIQEENNHTYRSTIEGKGHLCGHDAHTAMLMGAVKILSERKDQLSHTVRFIFQPAEEVPQGGAKILIKEGHLDGVNEIFGIHVNPLMSTGTLGICEGTIMASMDRFKITISGEGGHAAMPHHSKDPMITAAEIITALQTIVSRRIDPLESAVVSVCQINAGHAFNVIPAHVTMIGTARSLTPSISADLPKWIEEIATGIAKVHRMKASCDYEKGTPVLSNHQNATRKMDQAFRKLGGSTVDIRPTMGAEDFAFYLEKIPGCFGFLGAGDGSDRTSHCFHHPNYDIDEKALAWGSALLAQTALDWKQEA